MRRTTSIAFALVAGAAFGIAFVLSCGGDNHSVADAACSCPAGEPPLAGRLITVSIQATMDPNIVSGTGAACPTGAQAISGSCTGTNPNSAPPNLVLIESGFFDSPPALPQAWSCSFKNNGNVAVDVKATVICLKPAS